MAQLRAVGDHLLRNGAEPASVLAQLDAAAVRSPATRAATVLVAVLGADGLLTWASHGHPPPLLVDAAGRPALLPVDPAAPLGVNGAPAGWRARTLAPGDLVLLFTDGLVERPGRDVTAGLQTLLAAAGDLPGSAARQDATRLQRLCADLAGRMAGSDDDITLLAARLRDPVAPLQLYVTGAADLRRVRRALAGWADPLGLEDDDLMAVELVVGEAVANAVEHAHGSEPETEPVRVDVRLDRSGTCVMTVRDRGRWRPAPANPDRRGRGLQLIRALTDHLEIDRNGDGSTVTARRLLRRQPVVTTDPAELGGRPRTRAHDEFRSTLTRGDVPVLQLYGAIDMSAEQRLRTDLLGAGRGGALPLVVGLDGVSLLGSAGIRVLHELAGPLQLRLRAAPGTPARAVLDLTGLSDRLLDPASCVPG